MTTAIAPRLTKLPAFRPLPVTTSREDPDREMRIAVGIPISQLLGEYEASCARYRELAASLALDTPSKGELGWLTGPLTLRWILIHLTEETARHNGHIDVLRELADGQSAGDDRPRGQDGPREPRTGRLVLQAAERLMCLALPGSGSSCPEPGIG